jgi:hypothetical protein
VQPEPLKIFIGYDSKEPIAYHVLASSILRRASVPVSVIPLTRHSLSGIYTRQRGPTEATEFSLTRFLVPYLSGYQGRSVFMDCDMVMRVDVAEVIAEMARQPEKALLCCQHDYIPKQLVKFEGHEQTKYPRKNWSSFMVFDNAQCKALTPHYVNTASGLELHRFLWLEDDQIGALPLDLNWLVGEYAPNPGARILHYTLGTPCFEDYADCDQSDIWWEEFRVMNAPAKVLESMVA